MKTLPSDDTVIEIESERWHLKLQPGTGMQTQVCRVYHAENWHDIMPDCCQFSHAGVAVNLEHADQHAIHGALRKRPWRITEQTKNSASGEYDSRQDGKINWPWPIQATVNYTLTGQALLSQMTLTNHGTSPMPAGMGWHPYFCRVVAGANPRLTIAVDGVYPDTNGDCLPTGAAVNLPAQLDFSESRDLKPDQRIDHCLAGFKSPATISWPGAGLTVQLHASNNCSHLVLFNPDAPFFAVEPVTNANDGINLAAKGIDAGIITLPAGQTLSAEMKLQLV